MGHITVTPQELAEIAIYRPYSIKHWVMANYFRRVIVLMFILQWQDLNIIIRSIKRVWLICLFTLDTFVFPHST